MKKIQGIGIGLIILIALTTSLAGPAMAQDNYTKIAVPFSVDQMDGGFQIPSGSTIHHLANGITEVYGPDKSSILKAKDSDSSLIPTPAGLMRATYVYHVPSKSMIDGVGNITKVYQGETVILTVIDDNPEKVVPSYSGWIESSQDWSVDSLDYFYAKWVVPSDPPDPSANVVDFLFNAIEPDDGTKIIQPVLEWNYGGSDRWTGAAWVVWDSGSYRATPINASAGNEIWGTMCYDGMWDVDIYNRSAGGSSFLTTSRLGVDDLAVFCALEGYNIDGNDDVPGDTTFDDMEFKYGESSVDITWVEQISWGTGLTGLDVEIFSDAKVKLHTAN